MNRRPSLSQLIAGTLLILLASSGAALGETLDCRAEIDRYIEGTRRLNITLGEQPQVQEKLYELASVLTNKLKLKGGAESVRKGLDTMFDTAKTTALISENIEQEQWGDAVFNVTSWTVNRIFSQLEEAPDGQLSQHQKKWFKEYLGSLPKEERAKAAKALAKRLATYREALDLGKDIDTGKALAEWNAGIERGELDSIDSMWAHLDDSMIKDSIKTVVVTTASHWAPVAITMAVRDLANEAAAAGYNWVSNPKLEQMYQAYKKARADTANWRDSYDADTTADWWRNWDRKFASDRMILTKTREVMHSLGHGINKISKEKQHLSDEQVYQFLFKQFDAWQQEEKQRNERVPGLTLASTSYAGLKEINCHGYIDPARPPKKEGVIEKARKRFFAPECEAEIERFKYYSAEYLKVYNNLRENWYQGGHCSDRIGSNGMSPLGIKAKFITCAKMNPFDEQGVEYRKTYLAAIKECGWFPNLQATISGRYTSGTRPVPNAKVQLNSTKIEVNTDTRVQEQTTSGNNGAALFNNLPLGQYQITASADGFAEKTLPGILLLEPQRHPYRKSLELTPLAAIKGAVLNKQSGTPIQGARVSLSNENWNANTQTSANGEFELREIPAGDYTLSASKPGFRQSSLPNFSITQPAGADKPFVKSGKIRLNPEGGTLKALVLSQKDQKPISGATVTVTGDGFTQSGSSNSKGEVIIPGIPYGSYSINASASGYKQNALSGLAINQPTRSGKIRLWPLEEKTQTAAAEKPKPPQPKKKEGAPSDSELNTLCQCLSQDYLESETRPQLKKDYPKIKQTVKVVRPAGYNPETKRCYGRWEVRTKFDRYSDWYLTTWDWDKTRMDNPPLSRLKREDPINRCCTVWRQTKNGTVCWRNAP